MYDVLPNTGSCSLLGLIWQAMTSGNAIDDQRLERRPQLEMFAAEETKEEASEVKAESETKPETEEEGSDSDYDPNDIEPSGKQGGNIVGSQPALQPAAAPAVSKDPYEELEDDDDW